MVINYFKIKPLDITESELDEYEKYIGIPLYKEDREAILKSTSFRKVLAILKILKLNSLNHFFVDDLESNDEFPIREYF
ncbi:LIMLP_19325 family protein [Leptospira kirschneri]|uniref:LIMLP_19325 family protein n=1 Tax=Leptospira kirschneri TaxID=29507 RepID=UPI003564487C